MTASPVRVPLRVLPPHVRALVLGPARGHDAQVGDLTLRAFEDPAASSARLAARDATVLVDGVDSAAQAVTALADAARSRPFANYHRDVTTLVGVLACLDRALQAERLYDGNAYLASEDAVVTLLATVGVPVDRRWVNATLDELQALEMIYRFPVAQRFRGTYDGTTQCRANCWGRELHSWIDGDDRTAAGTWSAALVARLRRSAQQYRAHFRALQTDGCSPADRWASTTSLPIPVLI